MKTNYIGLDVHKDTVAVAIAEEDRREARSYGEIAHSADALSKLARKLSASGSRLHFAYEAGCCGFGAYRLLTGLGHRCDVVAPSMTPRRPGDRIKTDHRDALALARLLRTGELTPVWVPDEAHEAMRDLVRTRQDAVCSLRRARQQLGGFLLRHGRVYTRTEKRWGTVHKRWIRDQKFAHEPQGLVLEDYFRTMEQAQLRIVEITARIHEALPGWSLAPLVERLQAMRGISVVSAVVLVAELGDFDRFTRPTQLMAYVGLVPSETSSGGHRRLGGITKAGNEAVRRTLVECAWNYRMPARISKNMMEHQKRLPREVSDIAWKAQVRLHQRYKAMLARGKKPTVVITAIAREMVGFVWAIARIGGGTRSA
ncbi:MAG: IS110 family transposase [Rhizobiaceae bacterium]|nr:IS110 family transposase [Rhizobiaceae bacterium]